MERTGEKQHGATSLRQKTVAPNHAISHYSKSFVGKNNTTSANKFNLRNNKNKVVSTTTTTLGVKTMSG